LVCRVLNKRNVAAVHGGKQLSNLRGVTIKLVGDRRNQSATMGSPVLMGEPSNNSEQHDYHEAKQKR